MTKMTKIRFLLLVSFAFVCTPVVVGCGGRPQDDITEFSSALGGTTGNDGGAGCRLPGNHEAVVYADDNFAGDCDVLGIGNYPFSTVNAMHVGNDRISSVRVGANVKVTLYENDLPGTGPGDWMPVITSRSVVSDFNDKTSSIRVESRTDCSGPAAAQVIVWSDINFSGNCDVIDLGYPVSYAKILGLSVGNDTISSVTCGSSVGTTLWEDDLTHGSPFQANAGCLLTDLSSFNFNDVASSLVVR
jgi:hypothetical protein